MNFVLPLTEKRVKPHQITALHLIFALSIIVTGAIFLWMYQLKPLGISLLPMGTLLLLTVLFANKWLLQATNNRNIRIAELLITLCIIVYSIIHQMYFPLIMFTLFGGTLLFALLWEGKKGKDQTIITTEDHIKLPLASKRKNIKWYEIQNVILKFGILTVNCIDGNMYQWTIGTIDFDKEEFQAFCDKQVTAAIKDRDKNNW